MFHQTVILHHHMVRKKNEMALNNQERKLPQFALICEGCGFNEVCTGSTRFSLDIAWILGILRESDLSDLVEICILSVSHFDTLYLYHRTGTKIVSCLHVRSLYSLLLPSFQHFSQKIFEVLEGRASSKDSLFVFSMSCVFFREKNLRFCSGPDLLPPLAPRTSFGWLRISQA